MDELTGLMIGNTPSNMDSLTGSWGHVKSLIWLLHTDSVDAIITLRHFDLKNKCILLIDDVFAKTIWMDTINFSMQIEWKGVTLRFCIHPSKDDPTIFVYSCIMQEEGMITPFLPNLSRIQPINEYISVSVYYNPSKMIYEFHVAEFRWAVHILVKSIDDVRQFDRKLRSLYGFSHYSYDLPSLPNLRLSASSSVNLLDGYIVAEDLQHYMDSIIRLNGTSLYPDLLMFFELPVSVYSFQYSLPNVSVKVDTSLLD